MGTLRAGQNTESVPVAPRELVCLLDDDGNRIGVAPKDTVHTAATPLHLAFSCHLFDARGRTLVTRRALSKAAWPGVWSNSFCGHPTPDEPFEDAIRRRAREELGLKIPEPESVLPRFRYRAVDATGIVENEICPAYVAVYRDEAPEPAPHPQEVCDWAWVDAADLQQAVRLAPFAFSPWLALQLQEGLLERMDHVIFPRPSGSPAQP